MDFFYGQESALMGQKPRNDVDLNIIKGLYRQFKVAADPNLGYIFAPKIPPGAVHETKQPAIIAGMCITLLVILVPTIARLWIKMRSHQTNLGMDDYAIGAAAVKASLRERIVPQLTNLPRSSRPSTPFLSSSWL